MKILDFFRFKKQFHGTPLRPLPTALPREMTDEEALSFLNSFDQTSVSVVRIKPTYWNQFLDAVEARYIAGALENTPEQAPIWYPALVKFAGLKIATDAKRVRYGRILFELGESK